MTTPAIQTMFGPTGNFVTQEQHAAAQRAVNSEIRALTGSIGELRDAVEADRKLQLDRDQSMRSTIEQQGREWREEMRRDRDTRKPPLGAIVASLIGLLAVVLTMAGMAATLIVFAIQGSVAPVQRDVQENIDELEMQWDLTFPRLRLEGQMTEKVAALEKRIDALSAEFEQHRDRPGHAPAVERIASLRTDVDGILAEFENHRDRVGHPALEATVGDLSRRLEAIENRVLWSQP